MKLRRETLGIEKKLIREGTSELAPRKGDRVRVHYTGKLTNGQKFDGSRDKGAPFEFTVGAGEVIRGWELEVPAMKFGEKSSFRFAAEFGYGADGFPGIIPPNSTIIFELELLDRKIPIK